MDNRNLVELIKQLLKDYGLELYENLKPNQQQELLIIEAYFQDCNVVYDRIKDELDKKIDLSIRGICRGCGVAKSTIYKEDNKVVLKSYIDKRLEEKRGKFKLRGNVELIDKSEKKKLLQQYQDIANDLDLMIVDKIKFIEIENENKELHKEIDEKNHKINNLLLDRSNLVKELNLLQAENIKFKNKEVIKGIYNE